MAVKHGFYSGNSAGRRRTMYSPSSGTDYKHQHIPVLGLPHPEDPPDLQFTAEEATPNPVGGEEKTMTASAV